MSYESPRILILTKFLNRSVSSWPLYTRLRSLGADVRRVSPSRYRHVGMGRVDTIINMGVTHLPSLASIPLTHIREAHSRYTWWNSLEDVRRSSDKLATFQALADNGVPTVPWTTESRLARDWIIEGHTVMARTLTRSSAGRGIVVCRDDASSLPLAGLYTRRVFSREIKEFRIFFVGDLIVDVVQKRTRSGEEYTAEQRAVRSYGNGWTFTHHNLEYNGFGSSINEFLGVAHHDQSLPWRPTNLDFGAVDVLVNIRTGRKWVLETNSCPGLSSDITINALAQALYERTT